jgi:hypothetical protein
LTKYIDHSQLKNNSEGHICVEKLTSVLAHQKWIRCFENSKNQWCHSELFMMSQFFAMCRQNANLEQVIWTENRNMLNGESLRGLLCLQYNFSVIFCTDFHTFLKSSVWLLKIKSTVKYKWAHKKEDDNRDGSYVYIV